MRYINPRYLLQLLYLFTQKIMTTLHQHKRVLASFSRRMRRKCSSGPSSHKYDASFRYSDFYRVFPIRQTEHYGSTFTGYMLCATTQLDIFTMARCLLTHIRPAYQFLLSQDHCLLKYELLNVFTFTLSVTVTAHLMCNVTYQRREMIFEITDLIQLLTCQPVNEYDYCGVRWQFRYQVKEHIQTQQNNSFCALAVKICPKLAYSIVILVP